MQEHHKRRLRCVSNHEAYPRRVLEEATRLDILYEPEVRLVKPEGGFQFEANVDEVKIRCIADGNPKPNVFWRKAGGESILRLGETLDFIPVREGNGGSYFCWAKNDIGTSDELSVTFDVLYAPRKVLTRPEKSIDLDAGKIDRLRFIIFQFAIIYGNLIFHLGFRLTRFADIDFFFSDYFLPRFC